MKITIFAILSFLLVGCVADSDSDVDTTADAGVETASLLGQWDVFFYRGLCGEPTDPTGSWRVEFTLTPYDGLVMLHSMYPETVTLASGASLTGDTGRVRFESMPSGDVYDLEISDINGTASAFVHYEHNHCAVDVEATSAKHGRL